MKETVAQLEEAQAYEPAAHSPVPPEDMISYTELRSCADLYRMHAEGILNIHPAFQRDVVWPDSAKTRFIDSLVKGMPIPSMCFGHDYSQQRWIVIDGLQRMDSIISFLGTEKWTLSKLPDIDSGLFGASTVDLRAPGSPDHSLYTRVQNLTIPITVMRCDLSKKSHTTYFFDVFRRLNTGGMRLRNQEIRNCILGGSLNDLLKRLDKESHEWRSLNKMRPGKSYRFAKQELILRLFAFHYRLHAYDGNLAEFLDEYMREHRNPDHAFLQEAENLFHRTVNLIVGKIFGGNSPPRRTSTTLLEALLVGVSHNVEHLTNLTDAVVQSIHARLCTLKEFSDQSLREGLSKKERVKTRHQAARNLFSGTDLLSGANLFSGSDSSGEG